VDGAAVATIIAVMAGVHIHISYTDLHGKGSQKKKTDREGSRKNPKRLMEA
jgi:hypothetical protein